MKTLLTFILALFSVTAFAQTISYRNLNANQFSSNNFMASLKSGVRLTNSVLAGNVTNTAVGATKIIGTDGQSREVGVVLSGLTWDGTTLSLYVAPVIASFTNNHNIVEVGTTNTQTVLGWTLSGTAITSQSLNQSIGALAIGLRTYTHTNTYSTDRTYTLTVSDGVTSPTANTTVSFQSKAYWGLSTQTTLTDEQIRALSQEFATARQRTKTITVATENTEYIYLIWPASFGLVDRFVVDGFNNTAWTLEGGAAQPFVNAAGATVQYYVYRSNLPSQIGEFEIEIE